MATGALVAKASVVDGLRCGRPTRILGAAHLEVFASSHVVVLPAGIGIAPPLKRQGAYVKGGSCVYPLATIEPTGLVLMRTNRALRLGHVFDLWGQPLSRHVLASFPAPPGNHVSVFINGRRWRGSPSTAPLRSQTQLTVEVGRYVPPHDRYTFPPVQAPLSTHR